MGKAIKVQVSFTDDAGNVETLTSAATDAVAGSQPTEPPTKPRGLSATASHDSVTLTWNDPGDDTIGDRRTPIGLRQRPVRVPCRLAEFTPKSFWTRASTATTYTLADTDEVAKAITVRPHRIKADRRGQC